MFRTRFLSCLTALCCLVGLAGTAADLMLEPALLAKARAEFLSAAAEGYDCPIGPELKPGPQS